MTTLTWTPERLIHYPLVEHVNLAPNGKDILYTKRIAHLTDEDSEFRNQIWISSVDTTEHPRQLTHGDGADQPRWSPDGQHVAFLRCIADTQKAGIWVMRAGGGEAWPLTGAANGIRNTVTRLLWSPDGRQLAFLSVPWDEEKEKRRKKRDDVMNWRLDFEFPHLFVIDFPDDVATLPPVRQLTHGRRCIVGFDWSPDGATLAFTHKDTPYLETWPSMRLATIAADGRQTAPDDLGSVASRDSEPRYSPDGKWIACEIGAEENHWSYAGCMHIFATSGGEPRPLHNVSDEQPLVAGWTADSKGVYVVNQQNLATEILRLPIDGGVPETVVDGTKLISAFHINEHDQIALAMQDFTLPNSIFFADLAIAPATVQKIATPKSEQFPTGVLPRIKLLQWSTPDNIEVDGILYLPSDFDESGSDKLPLLLHIHGGPAALFQRQFAAHPYYYTPAALCERGIAVLRCNPRGSGGYGRQFRLANRVDWGEGDFRDLMQGVDTVLEMGIADPERLAICGWSYGGFMTSWAITQTHRFRAASIGAPVTNPMSFNGTADIPSFIVDYFGGEAWERPDFYQAHSPIFHVQNVRTPAIMQHGAADERVPLEQGLQYYNALQRRDIPVQLFIYPRQGHAILEPRLLTDAIERNLSWFTETLTA